jgi:hypothetical protein
MIPYDFMNDMIQKSLTESETNGSTIPSAANAVAGENAYNQDLQALALINANSTSRVQTGTYDVAPP